MPKKKKNHKKSISGDGSFIVLRLTNSPLDSFWEVFPVSSVLIGYIRVVFFLMAFPFPQRKTLLEV